MLQRIPGAIDLIVYYFERSPPGKLAIQFNQMVNHRGSTLALQKLAHDLFRSAGKCDDAKIVPLGEIQGARQLQLTFSY